jgi:hypothetical protein
MANNKLITAHGTEDFILVTMKKENWNEAYSQSLSFSIKEREMYVINRRRSPDVREM